MNTKGASPLLSVVINTFQAERFLEECLQSVAAVADEIVIVDMHSDDATREIARRYTDRIFLHPRLGYADPARNFALSQARGDWVLVLDADERVSPPLAAGLGSVLKEADPATAGFLVPFETLAVGRWLQGTGWDRAHEQHGRLFRRGAARWQARIHSAPIFNGELLPLPLPPEATILHLNFPTLDDFVRRLPAYSAQEAEALIADGARWSAANMLAAARDEILSRYQPGVDGTHSLVFSLLMAFYRALAWAKVWEKGGCPDAPLPRDGAALLSMLARGAAASEDRPVELVDGVYALAGVHADEGGTRWLGPQALLRVIGIYAAKASWLRMTLLRPEPAQLPGELSIEVLVDDRTLATLALPESCEGASLRLPLPATPAGLRIRLTASRSFQPMSSGLSDDDRTLAVRLAYLGLQEIDGVARAPQNG